ncbi:sugar phosphate isomerase/epimerase [Agriterribacter sp.]|uniref:sugar phosphate isomerase/epimerase family protein n=1 Tax=Agriterribacter sp. TaxID=2821509 RepID=UPI002BEBFED5|nr:sugar phosphate isomerase/epimerase [Agriterribacter sp.]HTN07725.1 sugar phosphate isomerase/epimerase [Agriterribacter sp.]
MSVNKNNTYNASRRSFLLKGSMASLGLLITGSSAWSRSFAIEKLPDSKFFGVQIGAITYSYRSMPHNVQQLLQYIVDSGISAVELMGEPVEDYAGKPADKNQVAEWRATVSMDKFKEVKKMFKKAGVSIYAFKPSALGANNTDAEVEYALRAAKALGANSVTVELPKDPAHSKRLGALAAKHKVYIGYHAHTQATDTAWDEALSQSPYNSMNLDCGHYIAAGGNNTKETLLALIQAKHNRITSFHIKDRKTKENGGANLPWGQGDTPLKEILNLLKEKKYNIPASIELEYTIPEGSDAVKETRKCLAYAKQALGA